MNEESQELIDSSRVSRRTREVLLERGKPDPASYQPATLSEEELVALRSVLAVVIPQSGCTGGNIIDIAARLDSILATGKGDGWRYATLPNDVEACRSGLRLLDEFAGKLRGVSFSELTLEAQGGLLAGIASGRIHHERLDLKRWFEDLLASSTQIYVSHPETLARMGYSGIADDPVGFVQLGIGQMEAWEPKEQ